MQLTDLDQPYAGPNEKPMNAWLMSQESLYDEEMSNLFIVEVNFSTQTNRDNLWGELSV